MSESFGEFGELVSSDPFLTEIWRNPHARDDLMDSRPVSYGLRGLRILVSLVSSAENFGEFGELG